MKAAFVSTILCLIAFSANAFNFEMPEEKLKHAISCTSPQNNTIIVRHLLIEGKDKYSISVFPFSVRHTQTLEDYTHDVIASFTEDEVSFTANAKESFELVQFLDIKAKKSIEKPQVLTLKATRDPKELTKKPLEILEKIETAGNENVYRCIIQAN